MKLVNLKLSPEEAKEASPEVQETKGPAYPWGLTLNLDEETIAKLDLEGEGEVGDTCHIVAEGMITGYTEHKMEDGESRKTLTIQITDLYVEPYENDEDEDDQKSDAKKLYPSMK